LQHRQVFLAWVVRPNQNAFINTKLRVKQALTCSLKVQALVLLLLDLLYEDPQMLCLKVILSALSLASHSQVFNWVLQVSCELYRFPFCFASLFLYWLRFLKTYWHLQQLLQGLPCFLKWYRFYSNKLLLYQVALRF